MLSPHTRQMTALRNQMDLGKLPNAANRAEAPVFKSPNHWIAKVLAPRRIAATMTQVSNEEHGMPPSIGFGSGSQAQIHWTGLRIPPCSQGECYMAAKSGTNVCQSCHRTRLGQNAD